MRVGINGTHSMGTVAEVADAARRACDEGFASFWLGQGFGADALTALAAVGAVGDLEVGVAVVPVWTRLPQALAAQALTTQDAVGGRLTLGIGVSHRAVVEGMWGRDYGDAVTHAEEYLTALHPLLRGEAVELTGRTMTFAGRMDLVGVSPPPVVLAALGPRMLELAGRLADGTTTGSAGPRTLASHIVPRLTAAAERAGRPSPRVIAHVVVCVTDQMSRTYDRLVERLALYSSFPSFRAMLAKEGVDSQADLALIGPEDHVAGLVQEYADAGVTDLVAAELPGDAEEAARTRAALAAEAASRQRRVATYDAPAGPS